VVVVVVVVVVVAKPGLMVSVWPARQIRQ